MVLWAHKSAQKVKKWLKMSKNIALFDQKKGVYERNVALTSLRIPLRVPKLYLWRSPEFKTGLGLEFGAKIRFGPDGELNPGLPRDRRGYLPLHYRGNWSANVAGFKPMRLRIKWNARSVCWATTLPVGLIQEVIVMRPVLSKGPGREGWFFLYIYENGFQWETMDILYIKMLEIASRSISFDKKNGCRPKI